MDSVTMRIFVMGLAAVLNRDGGGVDIVLPTADHHYPMVVFPCKDQDTVCAHQAKGVWTELSLPNVNLDGYNLLAFRGSHFGAVKLDDTKGIKIRIIPDPMRVSAPASKPAGRHHRWPMSMWYHLAGEVPQTPHQAKDASWLVSLKDILPCATPKALSEMTGDHTLAAYLSSSTAMLGDPIVASLSGLYEYTNGRCSSSGEDSLQQYAVTLDFNHSAPFTRQDQAAADAFYYQVTVDASVKIYLDTSAGPPIVITPYSNTGSVDILIANLTEFGDYRVACQPRSTPHGDLYKPLLHLPSGCTTFPTAELGWESTRMPKSVLEGDNLPDILGVVSVKNPGVGVFFNYREGASRPLCYTLTN
ncbi:MAG TPA: hypothetical protein VN999_15370 [Thermoanaerobaculia bacterium]|nr:hypothetical protein [Thermoanaerobaculia bacterium]